MNLLSDTSLENDAPVSTDAASSIIRPEFSAVPTASFCHCSNSFQESEHSFTSLSPGNVQDLGMPHAILSRQIHSIIPNHSKVCENKSNFNPEEEECSPANFLEYNKDLDLTAVPAKGARSNSVLEDGVLGTLLNNDFGLERKVVANSVFPLNTQESLSTSKKGIKNIFSKKMRQVSKTDTKDLNIGSKKKKSSFGLKLNGKFRTNRGVREQENEISSHSNGGCWSFVCQGPKRTRDKICFPHEMSDSVNSAGTAIPITTTSCTSSREVSELSVLCPSSKRDAGGSCFSQKQNVSVTFSSAPFPFVDSLRINSEFLPNNSLQDSELQESESQRNDEQSTVSSVTPLNSNNSTDAPWMCSSCREFLIPFENIHIAFDTNSVLFFGSRLHSMQDHVKQYSVHTQVDYVHCLIPDLLDITNCTFYWGKMDRHEAERLLQNRPEGTFILRDSAHEEHLFSVSFKRFNRSLHARIDQLNHKFSFDSLAPEVFTSNTVLGLLEHYKDPSCCRFFEPCLTNPLPRTFPFPLQHLCRATICSKVSYDGINKLHLPLSLKIYLKEYHFKQKVGVRQLD